MASMLPLGLLAPLLLLTVASADASCRGENWKNKTLEQRAREPDWIAFVQVVSNETQVSMSGANVSATDFLVVVNVTCWLKKGPSGERDDDAPPKTGDAPEAGDHDGEGGDHEGGDNPAEDGNMTVPDAGRNISILLEKVNCKSHTLTNGKKYVLFMEKEMDMFKVVNVNDQSGALLEPDAKVFEALHRGIGSVMTGKPEGECVSGVNIACFEPEGAYDEKVCDGSASVVATVATVMLAAIVAIATC